MTLSLRHSLQPCLALEFALRPISQLDDFGPRQPELLHKVVNRYALLTHPKNIRLFTCQVEGFVIAHYPIYDPEGQLPVRESQLA